MDLKPMPLRVQNYRNIVVLTGAGISAASGLRTYRGADGLWKEMDVESYSTLAGFQVDPLRTWQFYSHVRSEVQAAEPNAAHLALARLRAQLPPSAAFSLITQNVDSLHAKAGSRDVIELHGNALFTQCSRPKCSYGVQRDVAGHADKVPLCPVCGDVLRPAVTFFGEELPLDAEWRAKKALRDCDLFIAVGTSGSVSPAADFVRGAQYVGARTVYVNLEPMSPVNPYFQETVLGKAEELLPLLLA